MSCSSSSSAPLTWAQRLVQKKEPKCTVCEESNDRMIYDDSVIKVMLTRQQAWLGQCYIIPKQHLSLEKLCTDRGDVLVHMMGTVMKAIEEACKHLFGMDTYNFVQPALKVEAFDHFLLHFVPRYSKPIHYFETNRTFEDQNANRPFNLNRVQFLNLSTDEYTRLQMDLRQYLSNCSLLTESLYSKSPMRPASNAITPPPPSPSPSPSPSPPSPPPSLSSDSNLVSSAPTPQAASIAPRKEDMEEDGTILVTHQDTIAQTTPTPAAAAASSFSFTSYLSSFFSSTKT